MLFKDSMYNRVKYLKILTLSRIQDIFGIEAPGDNIFSITFTGEYKELDTHLPMDYFPYTNTSSCFFQRSRKYQG